MQIISKQAENENSKSKNFISFLNEKFIHSACFLEMRGKKVNQSKVKLAYISSYARILEENYHYYHGISLIFK